RLGRESDKPAAAQHAGRFADRRRIRVVPVHFENARPHGGNHAPPAGRWICLSFASTASRCFTLNSLRYLANFSSESARICSARIPALRAPHLPTDTVATGTPGGICTVERSESSPWKPVASSGTPITGRVEWP